MKLLGDKELSDNLWEMFNDALQEKAKGINPQDTASIITCIKTFWYELTDTDWLAAEVPKLRLAALVDAEKKAKDGLTAIQRELKNLRSPNGK